MADVFYPRQQRLFALITERYRNQADAISHYQKKYCCSRSVAYDRFNGRRSIDGDHFLQLLSEYGLHDWVVWPEGWRESHFLEKPAAPQPDPGTYLSLMRSDLKALAKEGGSAHLFLATNDLPLFLIKAYRSLSGFVFYFKFSHQLGQGEFKKLKFSSKFTRSSKVDDWLNACKPILVFYQSIPGTEYWSPMMFDSLLAKLNYVSEMEGFEDGAYPVIIDELSHLLDAMEKMASQELKNIGSGKEQALVNIFNHKGLFRGSFLAGKSENHHFCYPDLRLFEISRYQTADATASQIEQLKSQTTFCEPLQSSISRKKFFDTLRQRISAGLK